MIRARLNLEELENRSVPASFNVPWPEADGLTLSFAPDGTKGGNRTSSLFRALDSLSPTKTWQQEILRAFQTWSVEANINIGLVADGGQPFDSLGLKQGDPRFGDIRIGAYPVGKDVLAVATPYDPFVANTWVGDVFLNSAYQFGLKDQATSFDLFSVMLHEAGHVFGLGHNDDPNSPMFEQFHKVQTGLSPNDIAALQALYGTRTADVFEGPGGNDNLANATNLSLLDPMGHPNPVAIQADVTTAGDTDVYRVVVPAAIQNLNVDLKAAGISLLVPRVTLCDSSGNVLASGQATSALDNNVSLHLDQVRAGETYYVKVEGATHDVFHIGRYELEITPEPSSGSSATSNCHYGSSSSAVPVADGIQLLATTPGYVEHTYYEARDSLSLAIPSRTYRVRSVDLGPGMTNVMTVVASSLGYDHVPLQITVLDVQGNPVLSRAIYDHDGNLAVQIPAVLSNQDYFVRIGGAQLCEQAAEFEVEVDFDQDASHLQTFVNESLAQNQTEYVRTLEVGQSQQFHLVLSASDWSAAGETGVRISILDTAGRTVFTMAAADGTSRSGDIFLNQGRYTVHFRRATESSNTPVLFQLSGTSLSDPLGPQLRDTTREPVESSAGTPQASFYWLPYRATDLAIAPSDVTSHAGLNLALLSAPARENPIPRAGSIDGDSSNGRQILTQSLAEVPFSLIFGLGNPGQRGMNFGATSIHSGDVAQVAVNWLTDFQQATTFSPIAFQIQEPGPGRRVLVGDFGFMRNDSIVALPPDEFSLLTAQENVATDPATKTQEDAKILGSAVHQTLDQITGWRLTSYIFLAIGLAGSGLQTVRAYWQGPGTLPSEDDQRSRGMLR